MVESRINVFIQQQIEHREEILYEVIPWLNEEPLSKN